MKSKLFFLFIILSQTLTAQMFTEAPHPPFEGVGQGSIAFADVDGDNDLDVLITGGDSSFTPISKLYTNDGLGSYTEATGTPFEGVNESFIAFADVDGDNDQDVLITGWGSSGTLISKLYTNDGSGSYTEVTGTPFEGVGKGSIAFADVDGDGDNDVLITGSSSVGAIAKLYTNDGSGSYTEVTDAFYEGVINSSIAFADVDGDNDQDVLITGENSSDTPISKLYTNDGSGSYTEATGTPFEGVEFSSIAFADVDGDNDQDVLITGARNSGTPISKLYTNDGSGSYTEATGTPFEGVDISSIAFADVDGDNDQDVLITGRNISIPISKLYTNDGSGSYTEATGIPFEGVVVSSIAFADVDGDNDQDVLITGWNGLQDPISKLYTNDGMVSSNDDLVLDYKLKLTPYPNPSSSSILYLNYYSAQAVAVTLKVYDINGTLLMQQREFAGIGEQTFSVNVKSLTKGYYFVELEEGKKRGIAKFIVQ